MARPTMAIVKAVHLTKQYMAPTFKAINVSHPRIESGGSRSSRRNKIRWK